MAHSGHACVGDFMFVLWLQNSTCVLFGLRNSRLFVNVLIVTIKQNTIKLINIFIYALWKLFLL